jgi:hypothetical protein
MKCSGPLTHIQADTTKFEAALEEACVKVAEFGKLRVEPGDMLILQSDEHLSLHKIENLKSLMSAVFPNNLCVVLPGGLKLLVIDGGTLPVNAGEMLPPPAEVSEGLLAWASKVERQFEESEVGG